MVFEGSNVVLPSSPPLTNTERVCARFCILPKGCTRLSATSDKAYQLLVHGRWFSPNTPVSSTTKTDHHDIAEILMKVALKHNQSINPDSLCIAKQHQYILIFFFKYQILLQMLVLAVMSLLRCKLYQRLAH
jgi:hypothetical protein